MLLCALHPLPDVRREVLSRFPADLRLHEAASPAELRALRPTGTLVVLFDPARTAPADIRSACLVTPELVSISHLRLPAIEAGVDAVLPLRRLTARALSRVLVEAAERRTLAVSR